VFHLVSCIPQNEMVVLSCNMNGHVGSSDVCYIIDSEKEIVEQLCVK